MTSRNAVELAILEYEKVTIDDENNQWVRRVLAGLKQVQKDLEDFEWLKSRIGVKVLDSLPTHDKFELLRILGIDMSEWEN